MSDREFERLVREALEMIPKEFLDHMDNVQLIIEEEPSDELRADLSIPDDETLFGLYDGVPLTERTSDDATLPDRITIFRGPLLDEFPKPDRLRREVARTVIHEIAHHFGIDEDRLAELGWD
jgi:predicted Zn-dependent protease with MMP-like domain